MGPIASVSEPDLAKLSEPSELCGLPTDILKLMTAGGPLPQARSSGAKPVRCPFPATTSQPGVSDSALLKEHATATKPACVQCNAAYKALDKQGVDHAVDGTSRARERHWTARAQTVFDAGGSSLKRQCGRCW